MVIKDGGPAFPQTSEDPPDRPTISYYGLSVRDYFAAKALGALLGDEQIGMWIKETDHRFTGNNFHEVVAVNAYEFADAMLAERAK